MNGPEGEPGFDIVHPLKRVGNRVEPFPTIYWLRDGELHREVADLERRGWIKQLEARVAKDAALASDLAADHGRYASARWAMLTEAERDFVAERGWVQALRDRGVGGVEDASKIKCLHAHVAHALSDRAADAEKINAVGALVLEQIGD
ncbi:MAG: DUF501 domain-containing protein [Planctomycetota bacterium]